MLVAPGKSAGFSLVAAQPLLRERFAAASSRLAPSSRRTYETGHRHFGRWHSEWIGTAPSAIRDAYRDVSELRGEVDWSLIVMAMMEAGPLLANTVGDHYLQGGCAGLAPATVGVRAASLRWGFSIAFQLGLIPWTLNIRGPKVVAYKDTAGPGVDAVIAMLQTAREIGGAVGTRDVVILEMLYVIARRRFEVVGANVGDFDAAGGRLRLIGKGTREPDWVTVPPVMAVDIETMLALRGHPAPDEPLIRSHGRGRRGSGRLSEDGLYKRLRWLAARAGVTARVAPHAIRHTAITAALDELDGDLRRVAAFARHAKATTTMTYDDRRRDTPGEVAAVLASLITRDSQEAEIAPDGLEKDHSQEHPNAPSQEPLPSLSGRDGG